MGESSKMYEKNEKFLSIGALSRLTGVGVKSLRYYDAIGALRPAFVDPDTGYRYYAHEQLHVLEAIRLCVELDIPLSGFTEFVDADGRLRYAHLIARGRELAVRKIRAIKKDLDYLEDIRRIINRGEAYAHGKRSLTFNERERYLWVAPYDGEQSYNKRYTRFLSVMGEIAAHGLDFGYEAGLLFVCGGGRDERYYYNELNIGGQQAALFPNILRVPPLTYVGVPLRASGIAHAAELFPARFAAGGVKYVFEIEVSTGNYDYSSPMYEVRCSDAIQDSDALP